MKLLLCKLDKMSKAPTRHHKLDAGLDVYALNNIFIPGNDQAIVRTGIALAGAPEDVVILVWPKSGLDAKLCLHTGAGVIDPGYRGEILILLKNTCGQGVLVEKGDAVAQLVIVPCIRPEIELVSYFMPAQRGRRGGISDE